jgi:hypothetical protein
MATEFIRQHVASTPGIFIVGVLIWIPHELHDAIDFPSLCSTEILL